MRNLTLAIAAGALAFMTGVAYADQAAAPKPEIVEKDARGRPTVVRIDGQEYKVCTAEGQDGCINPREAGLKWGNTPLDYWPGKPASEK
ncbi:hypothetical protein [Novosphingobium album (ex Liu et al. 2023)]|uniref:Uncharacterized protein n=1 Tax=Novosphingobium album (ex Liu et al. 2023) TaxID=3031130 RepID=A0ABT5WNG8_9SPHN|nr:hypothetical protein [Novosphingobium album (ex Liu et al. 2023)]MDE8651595.1 hypothetical protein [Novosphingobium album (ex Liu et al. 2023)]